MDRIKDGIWWHEANPCSPFSANAFLIDDGGTLTLIDAGLPWDAFLLRRAIEGVGFDLAHVDRVLLTHYDLDHVGGLRTLVPNLDAPVYAGDRTVALLEGEWSPDVRSHKGAFHRALQSVFSLPATVDVRSLGDGDRVGGFTAFHTPGHNPDHVAYVNETVDVALLGDLARTDGVDGGFHPPYWWDSYDLETLAESVRRFVEASPATTVAGTGHGQPIRSNAAAKLRRLAERLRS